MIRKNCVRFIGFSVLAGLSFWLALAPVPPTSPLVWGRQSFHSGLSPFLLLLFLPVGAAAVACCWLYLMDDTWSRMGATTGGTSGEDVGCVLVFLAAGTFSAAVAGALLNRLLVVNFPFGAAMVVAPALIIAGAMLIAWSKGPESVRNVLTNPDGVLLPLIPLTAQALVLLAAMADSASGAHVMPWLLAFPRVIALLTAGYYLFQALRHLGTRPRAVGAVLTAAGVLTLLASPYCYKDVLDRDEREAAAVNRLIGTLEALPPPPVFGKDPRSDVLKQVRECQAFQPRARSRAALAIAAYLDRHKEDQTAAEADTRLLVAARDGLPGRDFTPQVEWLVARWVRQADEAAGGGEFDKALGLFDSAQKEGGLTLPEQQRQRHLQGWFRKSVQEAFPEFAQLPAGAAGLVWERLTESRGAGKELYVAASSGSVLVAKNGLLRARKHE